MNLLEQIIAEKRAEVARLNGPAAVASKPRQPRDFAGALRSPGLSIIAEIKRRSPSRPSIRENLDPARIAGAYEEAGAAAISCLTDAKFFGAAADDLPSAAAAVALPVLRKDFIIDPKQVEQSRAMAADAVLLIVRILGNRALIELLRSCRENGLGALVEAHDEPEVAAAVDAGAAIIGINNRDLDTLVVSLETSLRLRNLIPADRIAVAESGIATRADVVRLERAGFDAVLVGESLLAAPDPAAALRELRGARP